MLKIKKILCPTDFSEPSLQGLDAAVDLAKMFQAELKLIYVLPVLPTHGGEANYNFEIPEYERILHKDSDDKLKDIAKARVPASIKSSSEIGHGNAAKEIVRVAEEEKFDLIVIATHGHTGWHHLVVGSVAEKVIHHAHCPVFVIRETR